MAHRKIPMFSKRIRSANGIEGQRRVSAQAQSPGQTVRPPLPGTPQGPTQGPFQAVGPQGPPSAPPGIARLVDLPESVQGAARIQNLGNLDNVTARIQADIGGRKFNLTQRQHEALQITNTLFGGDFESLAGKQLVRAITDVDSENFPAS